MLELMFDKLLAFPAEILGDILNFFKSLYDPNKNILENIFNNELLWVGVGLFIWIKNGGQGCLYLIFTMLIMWLLCKAAIISLGIEVFALILVCVIAVVFLTRRGTTNTKSAGKA